MPLQSGCCLSSFPKSNHNLTNQSNDGKDVVYHSFPTSNHNFRCFLLLILFVVYHSFPTSNHNVRSSQHTQRLGCISFFSYIKPQPKRNEANCLNVVYHSFPTSSHNCWGCAFACRFVVYHSFPTSIHNPYLILGKFRLLYIILFLHQATTLICRQQPPASCISFFSYIKPQLLFYQP